MSRPRMLFDLGDSVKAQAPGQSGVAGHDINCRCFTEHDWMMVNDYAEAAKEQSGKTFDKLAESVIMRRKNSKVKLLARKPSIE